MTALESTINAYEQVKHLLALHTTIRRKQAVLGVMEFAQAYLPHHFTKPPSRMHHEVSRLLVNAARRRGQRIAIAAPRGHAKSTLVTLASVLWTAVHQKDHLILIVSATLAQAVEHLRHIRDELDQNERLHRDFPEFAPGPRRATPWRGNMLRLPNGVTIRAAGSGQQIRGLRAGKHRPSLIIADDLEMPEHIASADQRQKLAEWFTSTLLKCGDERTNVIVIGTVLHHDALLARLLQLSAFPGWTKHRYQALEAPPSDANLWAQWQRIYVGLEEHEGSIGAEAATSFLQANLDAMHAGAKVLWPEQDPLISLKEMQIREGEISFQSEKQNEPVDPEHSVFPSDKLCYWDDEFADERALLQSLKHHKVEFYGAWDPSLGKDPRRGDYSAVVIIVRDSTEDVFYVLVADLRRVPPSEMMGRISKYADMYDMRDFTIENNGFQDQLKDQLKELLRKTQHQPRVRTTTNNREKRARISLLEPFVSQRRVRFCRKHTLLMEQARQFPLSAHDDGLDALEMAISQANRPEPGFYSC